MFDLGKSRTRALALTVGAVAVGSLATFLALNGAEARLEPGISIDSATVTAVTLPNCDPVCSSLVVASPSPGGEALVVPGASAFGMALDAGAARLEATQTAPRPAIEAEAQLDFGFAVGSSISYAGIVTDEPVRLSGGYAIARASIDLSAATIK